MQSLFHVIDDVFVILRNKRGLYRQAKVYVRGETLYAGLGSGYVRLLKEGTSDPNVSWEDITPDQRIERPRVGPMRYLSAPPMKEVNPLPVAAE